MSSRTSVPAKTKDPSFFIFAKTVSELFLHSCILAACAGADFSINAG